MKDPVDIVLERLREVGFATRTGPVLAFGEQLPLVRGVAWDYRTTQVTLVARSAGSDEADVWRDLLFAVSSLRHHLTGETAPALATPVVIAVVRDPQEARELRALVEELVSGYVIFNRFDINLLPAEEANDPDKLDLGLAPLLPRCREAMKNGDSISPDDVRTLWADVQRMVEKAALELDEAFGELREPAGRELARRVLEGTNSETSGHVPSPIALLELHDLRSFRQASIPFAPMTVVHGGNGTGKSTLLEALELAWAGTSQRRPPDVSADDYAKHLNRAGEHQFTVKARFVDGGAAPAVRCVRESATVELGRVVLGQDVVTEMVTSPPRERLARLLSVTGLHVPELAARTKAIVDDAKREADDVLRDLGIAPLPRVDSNGLEHLRAGLRIGFAARVPDVGPIKAAEQELARRSDDHYRPREWDGHHALAGALTRIDGAADRVATELAGDDKLPQLVDEVARTCRELAEDTRAPSRALARLLGALAETPERPPPRPRRDVPLEPALASRWLAHAHSVTEAAATFRRAAADVRDPAWSERLTAYADGLSTAASDVPIADLERLSRGPARAAPTERRDVAPDLFRAAGFEVVPDNPLPLVPLISELHRALGQYADGLEILAGDLERHAAARFAERADRARSALCRFELARRLRRPRNPIDQAGEDLLRRLLGGRLYPVLRELVAAMVRFEWYFEPVQITVEGRQVLIGGLATPRSDLDARMLLNAAERAVVGVGWFLALHLLQPLSHRRVLVLDDPVASFDPANQAAFVSTLRAFCRLTRPEQLVVATHDDAMGETLEQELRPISGWPADTSRLRCRRGVNDESIVDPIEADMGAPDLDRELGLLDLPSEAGARPSPPRAGVSD